MIIKYDFDTDFLGHDEEYNEDYFSSTDYEFELSIDDMEEVAIDMVMCDTDCDKETAKKFVNNILWNYDLLEKYLEAGEDYVRDYFEEQARDECFG